MTNIKGKWQAGKAASRGRLPRKRKRGRHCCRPPVAGLRSVVGAAREGARRPIWFRRQPVQDHKGTWPAVGHRGRSSTSSGEHRGSGLGGQLATRTRGPRSLPRSPSLSRLIDPKEDCAVAAMATRHTLIAANSAACATSEMPVAFVARSTRLRVLLDRPQRDLHFPLETASVSCRHQPSRPLQVSDVSAISRHLVVLLQNRCCHSCRVAPTEKTTDAPVDNVDSGENRPIAGT